MKSRLVVLATMLVLAGPAPGQIVLPPDPLPKKVEGKAPPPLLESPKDEPPIKPPEPPLPVRLPDAPKTSSDVPSPPFKKIELPNAPDLPVKPRSVDESKVPYEVIPVAPADERPVARPATVTIGIFNHSKRDLVLEIGERTVKIESRRWVKLTLPREFNWREKDGAVWTTSVPDNADAVEIVFKR